MANRLLRVSFDVDAGAVTDDELLSLGRALAVGGRLSVKLAEAVQEVAAAKRAMHAPRVKRGGRTWTGTVTTPGGARLVAVSSYGGWPETKDDALRAHRRRAARVYGVSTRQVRLVRWSPPLTCPPFGVTVRSWWALSPAAARDRAARVSSARRVEVSTARGREKFDRSEWTS